MLHTISPLDNRYAAKITPLRELFSEFSLMKHRLIIEIRWIQFLTKILDDVPTLTSTDNKLLENITTKFNHHEMQKIKELEQKTNHDIKALEYYIKEIFSSYKQLKRLKNLVHFACTSEDINNLAYALLLKSSKESILLPHLNKLTKQLTEKSKLWATIPMLSRTHGQPATPTTMGKEIANFIYRLHKQLKQLVELQICAKFNGAVGNYNAHSIAYPNIEWQKTSKLFVEQFELSFNPYTTQIEPHDLIAEFCHIMIRINTILIDFSKDIWLYISINYFTQSSDKNQIGSSTMPHKVNPINFENGEGNLYLANSLLQHYATKLPISRWQRDLSDSTLLRNLGVAIAHSDLAYQSILEGLTKLQPNKKLIIDELEQHWEILTEAAQTVMRRYNIDDSYEKLKKLTQEKIIDKNTLHNFIDNTSLPQNEKNRLKQLTPSNYLGEAVKLAESITKFNR